MAILERIKIHPQQRFDLEDFDAMQAEHRSDSQFWTKDVLSSNNKIIRGFVVSGLGLSEATVVLANSTLVIPESTGDFSWFTAPSGTANVVIPASSLTSGVRNYLELTLTEVDGTQASKAFWDPNANSGSGGEFNQTVNTATSIQASFAVQTGGFTVDGDTIPVAILDVDGGGLIEIILDRREIFSRLATPADLGHEFAWGAKEEPIYTMTLTGAGPAFQAAETLNINTETATCVTGGTTSITFNSPSGINFSAGDTVSGVSSGASRTIVTVEESFTGVDKSIGGVRELLEAIMTEIKSIKGTEYWWTDASTDLETIIIGVDDLASATQIVAASNSADTTRADHVCDGTADNIEIQAAIDALPAGGGTVVLLEGTYNVASQLVMGARDRLIGQGWNTIIVNSSGGSLTIISATGDNMEMRDLKVDGNTQATTLDFLDANDLVVDNCWFEDLSSIVLATTSVGTSDRVRMSNNKCNNATLYVQSSFGAIVTNNIIVDADTNNQAIIIEDCEQSEVSGNIVLRADRSGIDVDSQCVEVRVVNNHIDTISQGSDDIYSGILVRGDDCYVSGNVIRHGGGANQARYGIFVSGAGATGNIIINNDLRNSGRTSSYNDTGTGTIINMDGSLNNWNQL